MNMNSSTRNTKQIPSLISRSDTDSWNAVSRVVTSSSWLWV